MRDRLPERVSAGGCVSHTLSRSTGQLPKPSARRPEISMEPMWQWTNSKGHLHSFWGAWRCGVELNRVDPAQAADGLSPLDRIVQNRPLQRQVGTCRLPGERALVRVQVWDSPLILHIGMIRFGLGPAVHFSGKRLKMNGSHRDYTASHVWAIRPAPLSCQSCTAFRAA